MTKTKNIPYQKPLVITGYILFAALTAAVLLGTTIPFGRMLFTPGVLHYNVALFAVALSVGAILPALTGYLIGDHAVKSKSKISHHFSGMLFGLLAYWVMLVIGIVVSIPYDQLGVSLQVRIVLANLIPSLMVAIITAIIAIAHVRSRQAKRDVLEYKPYSILLIASIVALPIWSLVNNVLTQSVNVYSFVSLAIVAVFGAISYATLRKSKLKSFSRVTWSAVSVSVLYVAAFALSQLVTSVSYYVYPRPTMEEQMIISSIGWVLAVIGWIAYWRVQVKSLSAAKKR